MTSPWYRARPLIAGVALITVTNLAALAGVAYNRAGEPGGRLELTERELSLSRGSGFRGENSGLALGLRWRVLARASKDPSGGYRYTGGPAWLDRAKLRELGFDVSRPLDTLDGRRHYGKLLAKEVLLVLELDGAAYREARARARRRNERAQRDSEERERRAERARANLERERRRKSRLFVVDAGPDFEALRSRYPDRRRYAIVRGRIRPHVAGTGNSLYLTGRVLGPSVDTLHVPLAHRRLLETARAAPGRTPDAGPRYAVTVAFGKRLEPWIEAVSRRTAARP